MKRVLAVTLLIIAAATIAFGQCSDADKKKLEDFDRAWGEASVRGDRAFLQNVYADNFVGLGATGAIDKAQTVDAAIKQAERDKANPNAAKVTHDYYMITCTPNSATITRSGTAFRRPTAFANKYSSATLTESPGWRAAISLRAAGKNDITPPNSIPIAST